MASGLKQNTLKGKIKEAIDDIFPTAFETAWLRMLPADSEEGNKKAKEFGETITHMISEPLSERLSSAIDYYIKTARIYGKFYTLGTVTVGNMCTQTQVAPLNITVDTMPTGTGGGNMPLPNMLWLGIE